MDFYSKNSFKLTPYSLTDYSHIVDEAMDDVLSTPLLGGINEMAYPVSFNMQEFKSLQSFTKRIEYCQSHLARISSGSSRIVYRVDNEKVLKLAKNQKGIAQNEAEGGDGYLQRLDIFAKVFDVDNDYLWIEMELAQKAKPTDFKRITGYDFNFICSFIEYVFSWYSNERFFRRNEEFDNTFYSISEDPYSVHEIFGDLIDYMTNYQIKGIGDLKRISSWGIVKREGKETLVLIDYGLNNSVGETYYNIREEISEEVILTKNDLQKLLLSKDKIDLSSFIPQDTLNPVIWPKGKINSKVRLRLLDISDDFLSFLNIPWVKPKDVILTGSLASFNYSNYSDFDLHILMDFKEVDKRTEFVKEFVDSKKNLWNNEHENLKIYGFPVELYVQDINEDFTANGIYSIYKNKWLKEPKQSNITLSKEDIPDIKREAIKFMTKIDKLYNASKTEKDDAKIRLIGEKAKNLFNKLKGIRKTSLKDKGEMSAGNILYKVLRRTEYLDKLFDIKTLTYDKLKTLN